MHSLIIVVAAQRVCVCVLCERRKLCYTFFMLPQQRLARNIRLPVDGSGWSFSYATAFCPIQKQKNVEKKNKMVGRTSGRTIRQKKKERRKRKGRDRSTTEREATKWIWIIQKMRLLFAKCAVNWDAHRQAKTKTSTMLAAIYGENNVVFMSRNSWPEPGVGRGVVAWRRFAKIGFNDSGNCCNS